MVRTGVAWAALAAPVLLWAQTAAAPARVPIEKYIAETWDTLTRTHRDLARAAIDPKFPAPADGRWPVYIPANANLEEIGRQLSGEMGDDFRKIDLRKLPPAGQPVPEQGLLYLPRPYVVPGGRFNEMYGWDSYFIVLGLLHDGKTALARDMVDNFLYEIANYGKVLNANRTYYLTRSQPPFLTGMILAVYHAAGDREWLRQTLPAILATHRFWTEEPHLTPATGLSRYFAEGEGPAAEVLSAEKDAEGRNHYDLVKAYYRAHDVGDYDLTQYFDRAHDRLKPLFYKGDRSMRESGFDPSNRFGPFSVDVIHYDPVCLNSLLYLMEEQTGQILDLLGRAEDGKTWRARAAERAARINRLLWDEPSGLYEDFNFQLGKRRSYPFLTTFYPLWAGIATPAQAGRIKSNLSLFEQPGGLRTSTYVSGNQWDAPFGWAPLEMIAVEGLRRYGFDQDADRIARKFLALVRESYQREGFIVEKYDVTDLGTSTGTIRFGYHSNEPGFGWTNAVYTRLSDALR